MCPSVSYSGLCGVGGTHAQVQIKTRTDGDTDSELMASEIRLGLSENYYFFEGWAVGGTRMLSMVDRLFSKGFAKLFRLILMKRDNVRFWEKRRSAACSLGLVSPCQLHQHVFVCFVRVWLRRERLSHLVVFFSCVPRLLENTKKSCTRARRGKVFHW